MTAQDGTVITTCYIGTCPICSEKTSPGFLLNDARNHLADHIRQKHLETGALNAWVDEFRRHEQVSYEKVSA
jgi:hypothetical protein